MNSLVFDKKGRLALPLVIFSAFLVYGLNNVVTVITPSYLLSLGGNLSQAGLVNTVFIVLAIVLRFIFAPLIDRFGTRRFMLIGALAFCATTIFFPFCKSFLAILLLRCVQSLGLATYMPCVSAFVTLCAPNGKIGVCIGALRISTIASLMVGPPIAYRIVSSIDYGFLFTVLFVIGLTGLFLLFFIKDPPSDSVSPIASERFIHELPHRRVKALMPVLPILATQFVAALTFGAPYFFGMVLMEAAFPGENSGSLFVLLSLGGIIAGLLAGKVFDKKGVGFTMTLSLLLMSGGFGLLALSGTLFVVFAAALLIGLGYYGCNIATIGFVGIHFEGQMRGFTMSLQQNSLDLGLAFGSQIFGALPLIGEGSKMVFVVVAGMLLCSMFFWFIGSLRRRRFSWKR